MFGRLFLIGRVEMKKFKPIECEDGGWTLECIYDDGSKVTLRNTVYTSVRGFEGRDRMQQRADENNALVPL